MMMPGDANAVKGKRLSSSSLRRAWQFARPYRRMIFLFLATIVVAALIELVPPFAFRRMLDVSRAKACFGFEARTSLDDGLARTVAWYRAHRAQIQAAEASRETA